MAPNPFILASDNSPELLPLLRQTPGLASSQDEHGYSLVHAAASYNHLDLLRTLVRDFGVDVDIKDEDDETALFVVETEDAAKVLVEELGADVLHKGSEGLTARQKFEEEGEFPEIAAYLIGKESERDAGGTVTDAVHESIPPPPKGLRVTMGTMDPVDDVPGDVDPEFRRRIEELAQRDDFDTAQGQAELRRLVEDAIMDQGIGDQRAVRSKMN